MYLQKCFIFKIGKVSGEMDPPMFDVTGLEEGQEYLFRVTAVNDEGESEPLTADAAIKAKNPFGNSPNLIYFSKSQSNLEIAFSLFVSFLQLHARSQGSIEHFREIFRLANIFAIRYTFSLSHLVFA